jgi:hypothetical protein
MTTFVQFSEDRPIDKSWDFRVFQALALDDERVLQERTSTGKGRWAHVGRNRSKGSSCVCPKCTDLVSLSMRMRNRYLIAEFDLSLHELRIYPKVSNKSQKEPNLNEQDRLLLVGCCWQQHDSIPSMYYYYPVSCIHLRHLSHFRILSLFQRVRWLLHDYRGLFKLPLKPTLFERDVYICQPTTKVTCCRVQSWVNTCRKRPKMSRLLTGTRLLLTIPLFSRHHHMLYPFFYPSGYLHWCGREKGTRTGDECSGHTLIVIHWVVLISSVTQGELDGHSGHPFENTWWIRKDNE